jgi:four helix bundle protein
MGGYVPFADLPVYQKCRAFRKIIAETVKKYFPKSEEYLLESQVLRSSRSVTANIAEGFGRFHYQENIQYSRQSRGSLCETYEHMVTAYDEGYITIEIRTEIEKNYKECLKELNTFIKYLKTAKETNAKE